MSEQAQPESRRSIFRLIADIPGLLAELVRSEIEQLKAEIKAKLAAAAVGVGLFVAATTFAMLALMAIVAAAVLALALVLPAWAAALIVAGTLLVIALILALVGKQHLSRVAAPAETISSIKKDVNAIKGIGKRK
jgi:Flp pilus assembly protein TadB